MFQEQLSKINARFREVNGGVVEKQRKLTKISEELESVKQEMEERGTVMTDGSECHTNMAETTLEHVNVICQRLSFSIPFSAPLINIKKALATLKEDVAHMNVQVGILQHDIIHSKLREKLLMQHKFHSQVYA